MSQITESLTRHHLRTAAVVAGGVAAVLVVQNVISAIMTVMVGYTIPGYYIDDYFGEILRIIAFGILTVLAFAVGVWFSVWRLGPLLRELTLATVVVRGLLAAAVGGVLVFVVNLGFGLIRPLSGTGSLVSYSFPELNWEGIGQAGSMAIHAAIGAFVQQGPIVVLAAVLVWIWLGKHPSRHAVSADAAEV